MIFARSACLAGVAALLSALPGAFEAPAAEPDRVEARFEIYGFAGLHVLTNRTTIEEWGDRYSIAMDLDTRGLASVFVDLNSRSQVQGKLAGEAARPQAYRSDVRRNGAERHYEVDYRGDGSVINASLPSPAGRPLLVAAEQMRGTVDQLTAYFLVERQVARGGPCAFIIPVFDGSGLYNLRFTDIKKERLTADRYQNFSGPAQVCGFPARISWQAPTATRTPTVRARSGTPAFEGDLVLPVRMEYETAFGVVKGYLAELRGRGTDLQLMQK